MKHTQPILLLTCILLFFGCGIRIEKRHYRPGFTVTKFRNYVSDSAVELSEPEQTERIPTPFPAQLEEPVPSLRSSQVLIDSISIPAIPEVARNSLEGQSPATANKPVLLSLEQVRAEMHVETKVPTQNTSPAKKGNPAPETRAALKLGGLILLYILLFGPLAITLYFLAYVETLAATILAFAFLGLYIGSFIYFVIRIFREMRIRKEIQSSGS